MRISDWSSDVCSSDLAFVLALLGRIGIFLAEQPEIEPVDVLLHGAQSVQRLMEEVRFVRVVDQLARHVRLAERYVESELRCASAGDLRSEEHTSELQSLMRISYAVFCLKKKKSNEHNR